MHSISTFLTGLLHASIGIYALIEPAQLRARVAQPAAQFLQARISSLHQFFRRKMNFNF
jgi:hypothetical protein